MGQQLITITFQPSGKKIQVEKGESLRNVAGSSGIDLTMSCGGKGTCGKCKVLFQSGVPAITPDDKNHLSETELLQGYRLACRAILNDDAVICLQDENIIQEAKILTKGTAIKIDISPIITKRKAVIQPPTVEDLRSDLTRIYDAFNIEQNDEMPNIHLLRTISSAIRESEFNVTGVFSDGSLISVEPGDTESECYGVAFDIGTTTIAGYLIDLTTGNQLSVSSSMNPQAKIGDDVISRISFVMQESDGLETLRSSVVEEMNNIIDSLLAAANVNRDNVYEASVVGNTCMTHLFMGIDPRHLAMSPYVPVVSQSLNIKASDIGLCINDYANVYVLPCIAGYVGADTVGVMLASDMYESDKMTLAVDIGTNGEIVLGSKEKLVACSTAAGPAFEGAHIKYGMRAAPGAIDAVWMDDNKLKFSTVDEKPPVGICGSGLLDIIIFMLNAGIIEDSGRIVDAEEIPETFSHFRKYIIDGERGNDFILIPVEQTAIDGPIVITQKDVREIQLAKSAIAAGILTLMDKLSITTEQLDSIILAGAFGNYVRKESAIEAGMLPNVPLSKVHSAGNAAGEGAKLALISSLIRRDVADIASHVDYVELTTDMKFQERFADALIFEKIN